MINIISDILLCENRTPKIAFMDWFEINSEQVKMALLTQIQSGQPVEFITPCVVTGYEDTIFGTAELNMVQLATALRAR